MKSASITPLFSANNAKAAGAAAAAERTRKALLVLEKVTLINKPFSKPLIDSMAFHCRSFVGLKPQVNLSCPVVPGFSCTPNVSCYILRRRLCRVLSFGVECVVFDPSGSS